MDLYTSTLKNPSSSRPGQAPDQHSTRLVLQSCLRYLNRLNRLERRVHEEIQEIRSLFMDILDNYHVTMEDSAIDSQAGLDSLNAIPPSVSLLDCCFMSQPASHETSFGVLGTMAEGTGSPEGLLPHNNRSVSGYVRPQRSMYPEGFPTFCDPRVMESSSENVDAHLDLSLCSTSNYIYKPAAQLFVPVVQVSQVKDKVKCTKDGCSTLVNKDNLSRHIDEVHEGKIKAVCAGCGQGFKRPNLMKEHILRTGCGIS